MDRAVDGALGLSAIYWATSAANAGHADHWVGRTVVVLNFTVGVLFLLRRRADRDASLGQRLLCLLSVPTSMAALALAPVPELWPPHAVWLFTAAGLGASISLAMLGRSFGVLPALRGIVVRGPNRVIRHPAYACELAMVFACMLARPSAAAVALSAVAALLVVVRIRVEEQLLHTEPQYGEYAGRVRFRLIPLLW